MPPQSEQIQNFDSIRAVEWTGNSVKLLDQRKLPAVTEYVEFSDVQGVANAISDMVVRGAPAIGITAAYGVVLSAMDHVARHAENWHQTIESDLDVLVNARPTAVNLAWAVNQMRAVIKDMQGNDITSLIDAAQRIHQEDIAANQAMASFGADIIGSLQSGKSNVLTHCNTGSLATGGYGTALGVIRRAFSNGSIEQVYADETRPWLQGSRLTAWELTQDKIPVSLLTDGAAAYLMQQGKVACVVVGADRITANGDVANKIGTYNLAVNARHHGVKFMVVAPMSTVDFDLASGTDIPIEYRAQQEVLQFHGQDVAAPGAQAWNPAFDITPSGLVDYIVTEIGVVESPNSPKMTAKLKTPR